MQYIQILIGFIGLIALAIPFSNNLKLINYKHVAGGILFQVVLAALLLKAPLITSFFEYLSNGVEVLKVATAEGTSFIFGYLGGGESPYVESQKGSAIIFAFNILPFIIVMSCFHSCFMVLESPSYSSERFLCCVPKAIQYWWAYWLGFSCKRICGTG
jgi:CNT family concentrative nucleoside transporter